MTPKTVSVVVPVYNSADYLPCCLHSMLGQIHPVRQLIICDDASSDGSADIAVEFAAANPDTVTTVLHDTNIGAARNLNSGLEAATSDYVSLCAGDDWWAPEKIANELNAIRAAPEARWAYSNSWRYHQQTQKTTTFDREFDGARGNILCQVLTRKMTLRNWLAERTLVHEMGYFDENLTCYEDWDLKIRLASAAPVAFADSRTIYYRNRPGSLSKQPGVKLPGLRTVQQKHEELVQSLSALEVALIRDAWGADLDWHRTRAPDAGRKPLACVSDFLRRIVAWLRESTTANDS